MICKVTQDLNNNMDKLDVQDEMQEQIFSKAAEFYDDLLSQKVVIVGAIPYHYDDFISEVEFDSFKLFEMHKFGTTEKLREFLNHELVKYCEGLAKEAIELEQLK